MSLNDVTEVTADKKFDLTGFFTDADDEDAALNYVITAASSTGGDNVADSLTVTGGSSPSPFMGLRQRVTDSTLALSGFVDNLDAAETLLITVTANDGDTAGGRMADSGELVLTVTIGFDDDAPILIRDPKPTTSLTVTEKMAVAPNTGFDLTRDSRGS